MTEQGAWLIQIASDWKAAELFYRDENSELICQAAAKYQQVVEKSIRAVEAVLFAHEDISKRARFQHYPLAALNKLRFIPHASEGISGYINRVFSGETLNTIKELCTLAPGGKPEDGEPFKKNTEYPFNIGSNLNEWTAPAADGTFTRNEIGRYRRLANQMLKFAQDINSSYIA